VVVEAGARRVFASALEWPGWSRSARDEAGAVQALAAYASRYAPVTRAAHVRFPAHPAFQVVERVAGNATTDFGAPGIVASAEHAPLTAAEARRFVALLRACWATLDGVTATAPAALRKGPRGGGRDRDTVLAHVLGSEAGYARTIGVRLREPAFDDPSAIAAAREAITQAVRAARPVEGRGWPLRYAVRRIAWHVLDHAWEIEDRSEA